MRIHLQSDIHMEFGTPEETNIASDVCVCAGDMGLLYTEEDRNQLIAYFKHRKTLAEHVIWVLGNHEFYNSDYDEAIIMAQDLANECGVHLLDIELGTDRLIIDGVKFWGTTFWSDAKGDDWLAKLKIKDGIGDFSAIQYNGRKFGVDDMRRINNMSREAIQWDADVVVTHFPPIIIPHPRFDLTDLSYYFYNTRLEQQIADSDIKLWLSGHTHHSALIDLDGTICASNQHGYVNQFGDRQWRENSGFNPAFILEI